MSAFSVGIECQRLVSTLSVSVECWHQVLVVAVLSSRRQFWEWKMDACELNLPQYECLYWWVFLQAQIEGQVWVLTVPFTTGATLVETGFFIMFCASRSQPPVVLG